MGPMLKKTFLQNNSSDSMMRLMAIMVVNTARIVAIIPTVALAFALIWKVLNKEEIESLTGIISAILGGSAGIIGTLLFPAFGGKVGQKFAEKKEDEVKK